MGERNAGETPTKTNAKSLSRRSILGAFAAGAGAVATGRGALAANPANQAPNVPEWSQTLGPGVAAEPYGMPSKHEAHVIRRNVDWLTASTESSINFTPIHELSGIITPNGLHFERHHGGIPDVDPADHQLMIHGLVDKPLIFTVEDILRFPSTSRFHFLECAANGGMEWRGAQLNGCQFTHGMVSCCQYTGVTLKTLLQEAGLKPNAKWLLAEGADSAGMNRSIPLEKALDDCLIAYAQNGERLRPAQGYPLRLVVPGWEGNMSVKWIRRIEVGDEPWMTREETSKYTDLMADGQARMFTWVQDANSVITLPSAEKPIKHKGFYEIQGLAWSGRGAIEAVHVSVDGGKNWQEAELETPVLSKCLTRFKLPWAWNGESALLQSRAIDETGYVQPDIHALQNVRGVNSIYHNNSIHTWLVNASGVVENVRVS